MDDTEKTQDDSLTLKQQSAIPHLITPGTAEEKASNAGISARTLRRWLQDSKFQRRLKEAGEEAMKLSTSKLELISHEAVAVLYDALHDADVGVRVRAAQSLIKLGQNAHYGERLEQQISHVEDAMALKEEMRF